MIRYLGIRTDILNHVRLLSSAANLKYEDVIAGTLSNTHAGRLWTTYEHLQKVLEGVLGNVVMLTDELYANAGYGAHQAFEYSMKLHASYLELMINEFLELSGTAPIIQAIKNGITITI